MSWARDSLASEKAHTIFVNEIEDHISIVFTAPDQSLTFKVTATRSLALQPRCPRLLCHIFHFL